MRFLKILTLFSLCSLFVIAPSQAQNDNGEDAGSSAFMPGTWAKENNIVPASPTAANLGTYGNTPVDFFSGAPSINIPLLAIGGRYIKSAFQLSYNVNALKVMSVPSWEGFGWALQGYGVISRSVAGRPDMDFNYYNYENQAGNSGLPNAATETYENTIAWNTLLTKASCGDIELQSDIYSFSMPGYSGSFIITKDKRVIQNKFTGLEITPFFNGVTLESFTVKDTRGAVYKFETSESTRYTIDPNDGDPLPTQCTANLVYEFNSSWFLSSIKSADESEEIIFTYEDISTITSESTYVQFRNPYTDDSNRRGTITPGSNGSADIECCTTTNDIDNYTGPGFLVDIMIDGRKYLHSAELFIGGIGAERVTFTAEFTDANYATQYTSSGIKMTSMVLERKWMGGSYQNTKKFDFSYDDTLFDRLALTTISPYGYDADAPHHDWVAENDYILEYHQGSFPSPITASFDHWGFRRSSGSSTSLIPSVVHGCKFYPGANRNASHNNKAGLIDKITYPTRGYTQYVFEGHKAKGITPNDCPGINNPINTTKVGGWRIKIISDYSHDASLVNKRRYEYVDENNESSGVLMHLPNYLIVSTTNRYRPPFVAYDDDASICLTSDYTCTSVTVLAMSRGNKWGNHIGYERVIEKQVNAAGHTNGKTVYEFSVSVVAENELFGNTSNGELKKVAIYNRHNNILKETTNTYNIVDNNFTTRRKTAYSFYSVSSDIQDNRKKLCQLSSVENDTEWRHENADSYPNSAPCVDSLVFASKLDAAYYRAEQAFRPMTNQEVVDYFYDAGDTTSITTTTTYDYQETASAQPSLVNFNNSDGKLYQTETSFYKITSKNIVIPDRIEQRVAGALVGGKETVFDQFGRPTSLYEILTDGSLLLRANIGTYHDGRPDGFTYLSFPSESYSWANGLLTGKSQTGGNETISTSYDYNERRLIDEITSPNGQTTTFSYDPLARMKQYIAREGNVVTDVEYHFATGSTDHNYVKSTTTYAPVSGSNLNDQTVWQYYDGMGRMLQNVYQEKSPDNRDIIEAVEYDDYGRQCRVYKPRHSSSSDGRFTNPVHQIWPHTENSFEASPLNRQESSKPPSWYDTDIVYATNTSNEVRMDLSSGNSFYPTGSLYKQIIIDPNGNRSISYTDKVGRVVMQRQTNSADTQNADTYNLYNDAGLITTIVPPGASLSDTELIYEYEYDTRKRVINKKVPGSGQIEMRYNNRDELVLTQDQELRNENKWLLYKYDAFGRETSTGFWAGTTPNPNGNLGFSELLSQNRYWVSGNGKTQIRFSKSKILGSYNSFIYTIYYYDNYGRLSYTRGNNRFYNNSHGERIDYTYDNADNIINQDREHRKSANNITNINEQFMIDHWGRVTHHYHQINAEPQVLLSHQEYDYRDRITAKHLHETNTNAYWQDVDYSYNEQDWLTGINNLQCMDDGSSSNLAALGTAPTLKGKDMTLAIFYDSEGIDHLSLDGVLEEPVETAFRVMLSGRIANESGYDEEVLKDNLIRINQAAGVGTSYEYLPGESVPIGELPQNITIDLSEQDINYSTFGNVLLMIEDEIKERLPQHLKEKASLLSTQVNSVMEAGNEIILQQGAYAARHEAAQSSMLPDDTSFDLFALRLYYNFSNSSLSAPAQRNGNISYLQWQVGCNDPANYGFNYDYQNRLTKAVYADLDKNTLAYKNFHRNNLQSINYDDRGNITDLKRRGAHTLGYGEIDDLVFNFITGSNQLSSITEGTTLDHVYHGFQTTTSGGTQAITYDDNGNLSTDVHRDAAYSYNHLNLPQQVDIDDGNEWVSYTYTASGEKLERTDHNGNTRTYCGGIEYDGDNIEAIYHAEGRATSDGDAYRYEYVLSDHLANSRVWFTDQNNDNQIEETDILQQNHYYPFGMEIEDSWNQDGNAYRYNGKELDEATQLYDYGARYYDPAIARWGQVDPLAKEYAPYSPYNYVLGNPIRLIDPDGMRVSLFDRMEAMGANHGAGPDENQLTTDSSYNNYDSGSSENTSKDCCGGQTAWGYLGEGLRQYLQGWGKMIDRLSFSSYFKTETTVYSYEDNFGVVNISQTGTIENSLNFGVSTSFFSLLDNSSGNNRPGEWSGQFGFSYSSIFKGTHKFSTTFRGLGLAYKHQEVVSSGLLKYTNEILVGRGGSGLYYSNSSTNGAPWNNYLGLKLQTSTPRLFNTKIVVGAKVKVNID